MRTNPRPPTPTSRPAAASGLLLGLLCVPMFLVLLDVMAMNVALPTLGSTFGVPPGDWAQVVDAYTVPLALGLLPGGRLVDRVGPRRSLLAGLAVFAVASAAGALAGSWAILLLARAAQGLAAAAMLPAGLAALTLTWEEPAARARALGVWSGVSAVATAIGPGVGGLLVGAAGWRSVFVVNVPLVILAAVGTWRRLPDRRAPERGGPPASPRRLVASLAAAAMMTSGANGTLQVVTVHLQHGLHLSPGRAGLVLLAATAPFVVLGPLAGRAVVRVGRRTVAATGLGLGAAALATLGHLAGVTGLLPALLGIGVGLGLMTSAIVGETMAAWPGRPGVAGGLNNALRQAGTSAGVVLGGLATAHLAGSGLLARTGLAAAAWWGLAAVVVLAGFRDGRMRGSRGASVRP